MATAGKAQVLQALHTYVHSSAYVYVYVCIYVYKLIKRIEYSANQNKQILS